jgi:hypothetical protein
MGKTGYNNKSYSGENMHSNQKRLQDIHLRLQVGVHYAG